MEAGHEKDQAMIRGWNFYPYPSVSGEGRGTRDWVQSLMANDLINCGYVMKPT